MTWIVLIDDDFEEEIKSLPRDARICLAERAAALAEFGPSLGRPHVGTLSNSRYPNMKELRFDTADGLWRVAFAFDPARAAILLVAGDKSGVNQKRFYKSLIARADSRFAAHLTRMAVELGKEKKE
ncbi:addiction module toxin RelE [Rhodospirillum rubrum]|nr:addiction module toxin RelE [Rhodospirillum rubrum]MBK1675547.1 addiction module toxin RelE [Rhodospirillum rubrum]